MINKRIIFYSSVIIFVVVVFFLSQVILPQLAIVAHRNAELKQLSLRTSPDQQKHAYFQRKFSRDNISKIDDSDYISVVLEQDGKNEERQDKLHRFRFFQAAFGILQGGIIAS